MDLHILFGQRRQNYEGEYAPEVLVCWDEFTIDENPEGFWEAVDEAKQEMADEMSAMCVVVVQVDQDKIARLLNATPALKGEVQE